MHKNQKNCCDDEELIQSKIQKIEAEYTQLGKDLSRLVLDVGRRIDGYADEIIELKQKREGKDK